MIIQSVINLSQALKEAENDPEAGIAIAPLSMSNAYCLFSAEIKAGHKVSCHYHPVSDEIYTVYGGSGVIYTSVVGFNNRLHKIHAREIHPGDSFTIPSGVAHQLKAISDLTLLFVCPEEHTGYDREFVQDICLESIPVQRRADDSDQP